MRVRDLGEFGLIARLASRLGTRPDVIVGIGDDAAVLDLGPDAVLIATTDAQVAGQHFSFDHSSPEDIGHKALAVNLSDIAAMGAEPLWALVSLVLPPDFPVALLDGIYAGVSALADRFGVAVVGGNVAATAGPLVVDLTVLGRCARGAAITRGGAHAGDLVLVTGSLGAAAAGVLSRVGEMAHAEPDPAALATVRRAQTAPWPRVREGRALAATGVVSAMVDVSDGLVADLGHIAEASALGVTLDASSVPVDAAAQVVADAWGRDPLALALTGGEDYELVCCVRADGARQALDALDALGCPGTVIGRIEADRAVRQLLIDGEAREWPAHGGWDHLRSPLAADEREPRS
jgi:thiamine-monophosphate kinase